MGPILTQLEGPVGLCARFSDRRQRGQPAGWLASSDGAPDLPLQFRGRLTHGKEELFRLLQSQTHGDVHRSRVNF